MAYGLVVFRARSGSTETFGKMLDGGDLSAVRRGDMIRLLWQQPRDKSDWLGSLLSRWSGKDFRLADSPANRSERSSADQTEAP